ncbi:MAG: DUF5615 family PIN-like protein [Microscillaceae bacterium]
MKLLLDQNLSWRIIKKIESRYPNAEQVKKLGLVEATDKQIWDFAKQNDYAILTFDEDFNELSLLYGQPPKILWLRTGNLSNSQIADLLIEKAEQINLCNYSGNKKFRILRTRL